VKTRFLRHVPPVAGCTVFLLAVVVPTLALLLHCVQDGRRPVGGFALSVRQWGLLAKSVGLAVLGVVMATGISIPGAYVVGRLGRLSRHPLLTTMLVAPLLFPPMVYVFGWQRVLPVTFPQPVQCIAVWALWAYPIPALLIGMGWARVGRHTYNAALLDTSPASAFVRAALPMLWPHAALSSLILFVVFLGEYSVPHACGLMVYATELLGWATESAHPIDTLWPSLPPAVLILAAVIAVRRAWGRYVLAEDMDTQSPAVRGVSVRLTLLAAACFAVAAVVPVAALVADLRSAGEMERAVRTYGVELAESLVVAGVSGLIVMGMGVSLAVVRPLRRPVLLWAIAFGALPGALVGEAILAAYRSVPLIYEHWLLVVLGYTARFAWIGVVAVALVSRATPEEVTHQARTDGADETAVMLRIHAALSWPTLLFAASLAAAMSLSEVATSWLVRVPSLRLIAHILMEKFHRPEGGMLSALSLWLVLSAVPAAVLLAVVLRRQRCKP